MTEQTEGMQRPPAQPGQTTDAPAVTNPDGSREQTYPYVYAIGRIEPRFPSLGVEREFAQATGRLEDTAGLRDREATHSVLQERGNRYLARQLCYVFTIEGLETYLLQPRDPRDLDRLVDAIQPASRRTDVDVVIGVRGPIAPPEACNGLMVPMVAFDQIYSFPIDQFIDSIPRPDGTDEDEFESTAEDLFDRILQIADNAGATDEHRALNYLAVRYDRIYAQTTEMNNRNFSLSGVEVRPSRLSVTRRIVEVIFSFRNRETDVIEKHFVRVDVTEEFPFLVTKMSPYFEH